MLVFSHPIGGGAFLPAITQLARAGHHVLFVNTRYRGNDSALIMEKCLLDLGAGIKDAKERFGYSKVVLGGWSGGGSLSLYYQEQAERTTVDRTPAGDAVDLAGAKLIPGDAIMLMAAHVSRSVTLTEWMDASIVDELDIGKRNVEFNLYDPANPNRAPYNGEFLARYRAAQVARNRRITDWVKSELAARIRADGPGAERGFVVHGTMADPRWLDATVDPNDREPGTCYLGDPRIVNMGPVGLARFCTLRSWLSQWSFDESRANGIKNAQNVTLSGAGDRQHRRQRVHAEPHASSVRSGGTQGQGTARDQRRDALLRRPTETLRRGDRRVHRMARAQGSVEAGMKRRIAVE